MLTKFKTEMKRELAISQGALARLRDSEETNSDEWTIELSTEMVSHLMFLLEADIDFLKDECGI